MARFKRDVRDLIFDRYSFTKGRSNSDGSCTFTSKEQATDADEHRRSCRLAMLEKNLTDDGWQVVDRDLIVIQAHYGYKEMYTCRAFHDELDLL